MSSHCVVMLYVVHTNFLHYKALACKCLVTVEVKPQVRGGPPIVSVFLYVVQNNFLHYRALTCKSLVKVDVKPQVRGGPSIVCS